MTTYRICAPHFVAACIVSGNIVIQAAPILHWTLGKQWEDVRLYFNQRGWAIEPQVASYEPEWLEVQGQVYELLWKDHVLARITLHQDGETRDLRYDELPEALKGLL